MNDEGALPMKVELAGDLAVAFDEWRLAAADLDGRFAAYEAARERHVIALSRLTRLATRTER